MNVSIGPLQRSSKSVTKCNLILLSHLYLSPCWILLFLFRLKKFVLTEPQSEAESVTTRISAGSLRVYEKSRGMSPFVYDCVDVSGPPHNSILTMTCKQGDHITSGNYFIIIILFQGKIMNCFFLVYRSWKVQANWQKYRSFSHVEDSLWIIQSSQRSAAAAATA